MGRVVNIFAFSVFTCAKKFVVVVIGVDIAETYHFDFCLFFPLIYTVTGEPPLPSGSGQCGNSVRYSIFHPSIHRLASPRTERPNMVGPAGDGPSSSAIGGRRAIVFRDLPAALRVPAGG